MDLCLLIIGALSNALTLNVTGGKPDELEIFQEDYILANLLYVQDVFSSHILRKKLSLWLLLLLLLVDVNGA